ISMNEVRKKLFTISLSGKAAHWYKLLKNGDSIDWEDIVPLFYSKFYPPSEIHKDRNRIYNFWPHDGESIAQAWGRLKSLMLKCPIHELPGNVIIDNFYARLSFQDKTLLDTSCSGSFTRNKEEFKRDLLDRIQENTEGWENDKDRESGIIYDYKCIEAFMDTDKFRNMSATYGLDSQVVANLYKAFASHYELPKKNFDKYHEPYKDKVDSSVNKCVVIETVDNVIPEAYIEKTPFPAKMKEYSVVSSAVNKSEKKPKEPEEQIKIEPAVAIVKDLVTENVEDGHIIFCEDASNIVSHPNKPKQVSVPMLYVRIGDHCYYGLCDIGASVSAIPYELYTEIMHEIGSCELEDIDVVIHLANRETISPIGIVRDVEVLCDDGGSQKGKKRGAKVGGPRRRGPWPGRATLWCGGPPLSPSFLRVLLRPENLSQGGPHEFSRLAGRRTPEIKELSRAGIRKFPPGGEIDAIAIVIELDIISIIIIIIISTIYTAITTLHLVTAVTIWVGS
ncbi:hypothetical protein QYE76_069510, partial [Lolium multiflorum]